MRTFNLNKYINNTKMSKTEIKEDSGLEILREKEKSLKNDIDSLTKFYNNEEDEEQEKILLGQLNTKKGELKQVENRIYKIKETIKNDFMANIFKTRIIDGNESEIYNIARQDAEDTVYNLITANPEEIAHFFSTRYQTIVANGNVRPKKFIHRWFIPVNKDRNIIPLSPNIETPQRRSRDGKFRDTEFKLDRILCNHLFIKKCQNYYSQFGIELTITKDKEFYKKKRIWIQLKIKDGILYF